MMDIMKRLCRGGARATAQYLSTAGLMTYGDQGM